MCYDLLLCHLLFINLKHSRNSFLFNLSRSTPVFIPVNHDDRDGVSNHQPKDCLLNRLFGGDQRKHQSSASLAFVGGIHRWPVNSPQKGPVTRKRFLFNDVIMSCRRVVSGLTSEWLHWLGLRVWQLHWTLRGCGAYQDLLGVCICWDIIWWL